MITHFYFQTRMNKFYKHDSTYKIPHVRGVCTGMEVVFMTRNIDLEFEEFVLTNYKRLTENQKKLCSKLGISVPA